MRPDREANGEAISGVKGGRGVEDWKFGRPGRTGDLWRWGPGTGVVKPDF